MVRGVGVGGRGVGASASWRARGVAPGLWIPASTWYAVRGTSYGIQGTPCCARCSPKLRPRSNGVRLLEERAARRANANEAALLKQWAGIENGGPDYMTRMGRMHERRLPGGARSGLRRGNQESSCLLHSLDPHHPLRSFVPGASHACRPPRPPREPPAQGGQTPSKTLHFRILFQGV